MLRAVAARTPTCATAAEARAPALRAGAGGFTLVELLVALAILAGAIALVPPALDRLRESMRYRDAVRQVVADLRVARQRAQAEGRDVRFVVDLAQRQFGLDGTPRHALPPPLQMRVTVAGVEWTAQQTGAIRFLAQGGATGGTVEVLRPDGRGTRVTVDWLSAAVSQSAVEP